MKHWDEQCSNITIPKVHTYFLNLINQWNYTALAYSAPDSQCTLCDLFSKTIPAEQNADTREALITAQSSFGESNVSIAKFIMTLNIMLQGERGRNITITVLSQSTIHRNIWHCRQYGSAENSATSLHYTVKSKIFTVSAFNAFISLLQY